MNGVDPQAYLRDVLARIVARHPMGRIDELRAGGRQGCGLTTPLTLQWFARGYVSWNLRFGMAAICVLVWAMLMV
jgi:hypothetical protein